MSSVCRLTTIILKPIFHVIFQIVYYFTLFFYARTDNLKMGCGAVCHYHLKKSIPCHVKEEWRPVYHKSQIPDITCKCYNFSFKQVMTLGFFFFIWKSGAWYIIRNMIRFTYLFSRWVARVVILSMHAWSVINSLWRNRDFGEISVYCIRITIVS